MSFRCLKNVGFANLEDTLHSYLKTSRLVIHKTSWKNVSWTSYKTDFSTFLKKWFKSNCENLGKWNFMPIENSGNTN